MVFVIAGLVISYRLDFEAFTSFDVGVHFLLYATSTFVRGTIVACVWAIEHFLLERRVDWRDAVVTTWGGLRGAVGLALALMVFDEDDRICKRVRDTVLFHTSGIVVLTVVVNSISMRKVIAMLGINEETHEKVGCTHEADHCDCRRLTGHFAAAMLPRCCRNAAAMLLSMLCRC